jgi:hypothetical protein
MDFQHTTQDTNTYLGQQERGLTFASVLNSLLYLGTILIIGYYLWNWWQNTKKLKIGLKHQKEGFQATTSEPETDTLAFEIPATTQAKVSCPTSTLNPSETKGIWDGAEDGHILFEEPTRKWTGTKLGQNRYSPGINQGLEELKKKYTGLIIETTKEMIPTLQQLGLENYIQVLEDLDKIVSANSQIAQIKALSQAQLELLPELQTTISDIINNPNAPEFVETGLSTMTHEELGHRITRNRQMREYLESRQSTRGPQNITDILANKPAATELINIANTQLVAYKTLIPLLDEVISKRAKYETEKQEILELLDIGNPYGVSANNAMTNQSADNTAGLDGGTGQIPDGVVAGNNRSPTSDKWPQRYYLNKRSAAIYQNTRMLDELRAQLQNPPGGLTPEEYQAKYNWIDRIGKDKLPVPDDPEIKFALPAGMVRTIPDILTDFDHYNANCQRIYEECSTRANTPGFALPNWDTADYYDYLDRLPNANQASAGISPH